MEFELVLRRGRVFTGDGSPGEVCDLGIAGGRVVARAPDLGEVGAVREIDAGGSYVLPGFVDVHTHYDLCLDWPELSAHCLRQGITSVVGGNCGLGEPDTGAVLEHAGRAGLGVHFGVLAPLGPLRSRVVPRAEGRAADAEERALIAREVEGALDAGALGVSWGPYHANSLMDADEIQAALAPAARRDRPWCVHRRREGIGGLEATVEALELAKAAGVPLQISHLKAAGKLSWDSLEPVLECVDAARSEQDLSVDVYPYDASLTYLSAMIPDALKADGKLAEVLADPGRRPLAAKGVEAWFERRMGPQAIVILEPALADVPPSSSLEEAAQALGVDPVEAALRLIEAEAHTTGGWAIYREMMDPQQVEAVLDLPYAAVASDAVPEEDGGAISAHPRAFASFTRALARAERIGEARFADAVRQATRLPADRFGLRERGRIEVGAAADLVVLGSLEEGASYRDPCVYPRGVDYVVVAGQVALEAGEPTGVRAGTLLRPPG